VSARDTVVGVSARDTVVALGEISGPEEFAEVFSAVHAQVCSVVRGKSDEVRLALVCVFSEGHLLVEDVPGVGKTTLAKAIAHSLGLSCQRVQFTPDLVPSDITGSNIFDRATNQLVFRPGGVFANIVLADEINRASPKAQAALLEAMEERQVTVDGTTYHLPEPFVVIATQNPFEHEGTFPLPASELDRFLLRLQLGYPDRRSAIEILQDQPSRDRVDSFQVLVPPEKVRAMTRFSATTYIAPALQSYLVDLAEATRCHPGVAIGLSPRAVLGAQRASRCLAASFGRDHVGPDDIKALLGPVGEHRIVVKPKLLYSQGSASDVVSEALASVAMPVPGTAHARSG
jgi:MoxR-like ATPase